MEATASAPTPPSVPGAFPPLNEEDVLRQLAHLDSIFSPTLSVLPTEDAMQPPVAQLGTRHAKDVSNQTTLEQSGKEGQDAAASILDQQRGELPNQSSLQGDNEETADDAVVELPATETSSNSENEPNDPPSPSESNTAYLAKEDDNDDDDEAPSAPSSSAAAALPHPHSQVERDDVLVPLAVADSVGTDEKEVGRMGRWRRLWGALRGRRMGRRNGGGGEEEEA